MNERCHDGTHVEFRVQKQFTDARRLDHYVASRLSALSRSEIQRLIAAEALTLNGQKTKASHKVRQGDHIVIELPEALADKPQAQDIPIEIIYEDEFMVVLNKQAAMIVHPGRGKENWSGTLTNALQYHFDHLSSYGGSVRPGIVHRLDRDTTGVLLVAKDDYAHKNLAAQFEYRKVSKEYLAVCYGRFDRDSDYVEKPIGPHPQIREKMAIRPNPAVGKSAVTFYEVIERFDGFTLVRLHPHTGRTHQLRVHMEVIGNPIVADKAYSGRSVLRFSDLTSDLPEGLDDVIIDRQALHAHRIQFRHPRCHEPMDITVPPPPDFVRTLTALRSYRAASAPRLTT